MGSIDSTSPHERANLQTRPTAPGSPNLQLPNMEDVRKKIEVAGTFSSVAAAGLGTGGGGGLFGRIEEYNRRTADNTERLIKQIAVMGPLAFA